jgi:hypothetical protein
MSTYALLDANGLIVNRIDLDNLSDWPVPDGHTLVPDEGYNIGGSIAGGVYTPPASDIPVPQPPSVPQSVTPRQARLALLAAGLLDAVEAAVNAAGGATKVTWDFATVINRTDPLISTIGSSLNLTSDQIDVLFKYAATQ